MALMGYGGSTITRAAKLDVPIGAYTWLLEQFQGTNSVGYLTALDTRYWPILTFVLSGDGGRGFPWGHKVNSDELPVPPA